MNALVELSGQGVHGLVGSSSSNPTMAMATIAGLPIVDLVLVGFMAGSPALSAPAKYPTFLRVNPSISNVVHAIASLIQCSFCFFSMNNKFSCPSVHTRAGMFVCISSHAPCVHP